MGIFTFFFHVHPSCCLYPILSSCCCNLSAYGIVSEGTLYGRLKWHSKNKKWKMLWMKWSEVIKPKWWWRFGEEKGALWRRLIASKYGEDRDGGLIQVLGIVGLVYGVALLRRGMCRMWGGNSCPKGWVLWWGMGGDVDSYLMIRWKWDLCVGCFPGCLEWYPTRRHLSVIAMWWAMVV